MIGDIAINNLLEAFHGCKRRGENATLFLETRNGNAFATLQLKLPASRTSSSKASLGKTTSGSTRKKSPSTLKRDRERLENFVKKKSFQETWCPNLASTPAMKTQTQETQVFSSSQGSHALDNKSTVMDGDNVEKFEESVVKMPNKNGVNIEEAGNQLDWEMILENNKKINELLHSLHSDVTGNNKNKEIDLSDNLEEAKLWAKNQKQSLATKK